jgi:hypothetical protein
VGLHPSGNPDKTVQYDGTAVTVRQ